MVPAILDLVRERLASQYLTTRGLDSGAAVVRALGAVQAQDYPGAKWALSQRARGATDAALERELTDGAILRTHVLRPTWHFVAPEDIRWMLALTAPRVKRVLASYDRRLEITAPVLRRSHATIAKALTGGMRLTRTELRALLEKARIGTTPPQRLAHLVMHAELDALICSGGRRGDQFTYALLDERAPSTRALGRDEALLELTRRYFRTRSPATAHDFAWWSGLTLADVRRGIGLAGRELEEHTSNDRPYWRMPRNGPAPSASPTAHLLPNYDEYFIGFRDRSAIGVRLGHFDPVTGGTALNAHIVFVDGQIVGGWKRVVEGRKMIVAATWLVSVTTAERKRVDAAARAFGAFLGMPVELRPAATAAGRIRPASSGRGRGGR